MHPTTEVLLTLAARDRKGSAGRFSASKLGVALLVLCVLTAIASPAQTLATLHSFEGYPSDGGTPNAGLVQATDGNFYGTTIGGGASSNCYGGCGTVFEITPSGTVTTLHSFQFFTDGNNPYAGLVQATDGNFYGTTIGGGANEDGTVFKITQGAR